MGDYFGKDVFKLGFGLVNYPPTKVSGLVTIQ